MRDIKLMDETLSNKIAAGEIIERPLSVVKELVENSIDSGATVISIDLKASGVENILIMDNGSGMNEANIKLSVKRHATSKLYDEKELFKIATLGFRGEALASMSSVSRFTITSSVDGINGYELSIVDREESFKEVPFNKGTKVEVKDLFFNTPVRFKHLSNPFYELALVVNHVSKIALLNPNISFSLTNDGKELFYSSGNGDMGAIFSKVYSLEIARNMTHLKGDSDNFEVELYICSPEFTKSRRNYMTICVNDRIVKNYNIENAIVEGYKNFLHINQFPIVMVNIKVDYDLIDVNIHPTKQQIKISMIDELESLITDLIKESLSKKQYVPDVSFSEPKMDDFEPFTMNLEDSSTSYEVNKEQHFLDIQQETKKDVNWKLPHFEYVGTFHATYLLFQNEDGLHLVDQHAAQERIKYEQFFKKFQEKKFEYQLMLVPLVFEVSKEEYMLLQDKLDAFENIGIKMEEFGINTFKVSEIDNFYMKAKDLNGDINKLIELLVINKELDFSKLYEDVAIMMACKSSIKANYYINRLEIDDLMVQLNDCESPFTCPHGRPIIINVTTYEIEKLFKRVV